MSMACSPTLMKLLPRNVRSLRSTDCNAPTSDLRAGAKGSSMYGAHVAFSDPVCLKSRNPFTPCNVRPERDKPV